MPKMIQVRSVPDRLHRELVRRARKRGRTVTSYIREILEREVSRPLAEEVFEQIARATPVIVLTPRSSREPTIRAAMLQAGGALTGDRRGEETPSRWTRR